MEWRDRLEKLNAQISAMPAYSDSGENSSGILSEAQSYILRDYDRNKSGKRLDDIVRRYIAGHNAVYEGIIYLQSPYRSLAIFALVLAYSFDLSGFVFGFVIQAKNMRKERYMSVDDDSVQQLFDEGGEPGWSILQTKNRYMVLPGDYECRDGEYFYSVFRDGIREQWRVQDEAPYKRGIYLQGPNPLKGRLVMLEQGRASDGSFQEMLFSGQPDGPRDGIYKECQLFFEEGSLFFIHLGEKKFIASIDDYVPVHSYHPGKGENQTLPAKELFKNKIQAEIAVVALNAKGTRVSAVYVVEKADVNELAAYAEDET